MAVALTAAPASAQQGSCRSSPGPCFLLLLPFPSPHISPLFLLLLSTVTLRIQLGQGLAPHAAHSVMMLPMAGQTWCCLTMLVLIFEGFLTVVGIRNQLVCAASP